MARRPSLVRSIPFWILVILSLGSALVGGWLVFDTLSLMTTTLTDGTATGVDVYVGQVRAIVGGILVATGIIGLALVLVLAVLRSFVPAAEVEIIEPIDWDDESAADAGDHGVERDSGHTAATDIPASAEDPESAPVASR